MESVELLSGPAAARLVLEHGESCWRGRGWIDSRGPASRPARPREGDARHGRCP